MAGSLSTYLENAWLNHFLRNSTFAAPATVYCAAITSVADAEAGSVTEVTTVGTAYTRQAITFGVPASRQTSNTNTLNFAQATANWGTVTTLGVYDASVGGNLLYWMTMPTSQTVNTGDTFSVPAGSLVVTQGGGMTNFLAHAMLSHTLRATTYTPPVTVYAALLTVVTDIPTAAVTEVSGGAYTRQSVAYSAVSGGTTANSGLITYPTATLDWGTIVSYGIYDASTLGNLLIIPTGGLQTAKAVATGATPTFAIGALSAALD